MVQSVKIFFPFRSIVQIKNHFSAGIIIYSVNEHDVYKKLAHVKPDQVQNFFINLYVFCSLHFNIFTRFLGV